MKKQKGGVLKGKNRQTSKQKGGQIQVSYDDVAGFSIGYKKKLKNKKKKPQKGGSSAVKKAIYNMNPGIAGRRVHPPFRSTNPYQIQKGGTAIYDPNWNYGNIINFGGKRHTIKIPKKYHHGR